MTLFTYVQIFGEYPPSVAGDAFGHYIWCVNLQNDGPTLEQEKSQFNDSMEYLKALKERPKKLKIRMARIRDEPQGWDQKESGK